MQSRYNCIYSVASKIRWLPRTIIIRGRGCSGSQSWESFIEKLTINSFPVVDQKQKWGVQKKSNINFLIATIVRDINVSEFHPMFLLCHSEGQRGGILTKYKTYCIQTWAIFEKKKNIFETKFDTLKILECKGRKFTGELIHRICQ